MVRLEHAKVRVQRLIPARFPRLPLQRTDLAFHFLDDVADAQQIRLGCLKLPECFAFLRLVLRDAGGFFEDRTTCHSIPSSSAQSVNVSETSAKPTGLRVSAPLKITSAISSPRSDLADCSPSAHRTASSTFDFPQPFGPTIAVTPS